ncbi:dTMP kinase [Oscillatoria sp. FACHB-1407]|uniref:dTMP kinase n=1 Tax=Oscillatoria sp. FACHB-1407 TaxID=2692847 RepID=UPI00168679FA|nr:dTMP kinase [Oscillatoria sp. FACHB-1407]MBD2463339.1 dTMP kinase [Oscillatoria sp. FACHB-1407]
MSGRFIVFEGVEGSGKTTQVQRLQTWLLQNQPLLPSQTNSEFQIVVTREPGGTDVGQEIRQLLLHSEQEPIADRAELLLYAADRAQHVEAFLKPRLTKGHWVLCDRYTDSTIAYQGYGRGLDHTLIDQLNQIATGGLQSDLTLWLDLEVETGLARTQRRGASDRMEKAELAFHQRVQQGFVKLAEQHPQRIVRIDASGTEEQVAERIQTVVKQRFSIAS